MKKTLLTFTALTFLTFSIGAADVDIKGVYERHCAKCHGSDGSGLTNMGHKLGITNFADVRVQANLTNMIALKAIKDGVKDGEKIRMKPSDVDSKTATNLVDYIRSFKK